MKILIYLVPQCGVRTVLNTGLKKSRVISMTDQEKVNVRRRRERGESYGAIAKIMGLNVNSVKSFCRREKIQVGVITVTDSDDSPELIDEQAIPLTTKQKRLCELCGEPVLVLSRQANCFCSDSRIKYWRGSRKSYATEHTCQTWSYLRKKDRNYCSHNCYINHRFKSKVAKIVGKS